MDADLPGRAGSGRRSPSQKQESKKSEGPEAGNAGMNLSSAFGDIDDEAALQRDLLASGRGDSISSRADGMLENMCPKCKQQAAKTPPKPAEEKQVAHQATQTVPVALGEFPSNGAMDANMIP